MKATKVTIPLLAKETLHTTIGILGKIIVILCCIFLILGFIVVVWQVTRSQVWHFLMVLAGAILLGYALTFKSKRKRKTRKKYTRRKPYKSFYPYYK